MHDAGKVIIGLVIFLVLITFPIWYNALTAESVDKPEVVIATADDSLRGDCVMDGERMVTEHMDLLNDWREESVRHNERVYVTGDGRVFEKSLTNTCLDCHSNKEQFCDRCHTYMSVSPYCWDCHITPQDLEGRMHAGEEI